MRYSPEPEGGNSTLYFPSDPSTGRTTTGNSSLLNATLGARTASGGISFNFQSNEEKKRERRGSLDIFGINSEVNLSISVQTLAYG